MVVFYFNVPLSIQKPPDFRDVLCGTQSVFSLSPQERDFLRDLLVAFLQVGFFCRGLHSAQLQAQVVSLFFQF